ncbi:MAG TPA: ABC transporter ATP-binding protein [Polyangia bacterium]|nr:ABC transporter ATP-binding protein [Polyangia bacterium]
MSGRPQARLASPVLALLLRFGRRYRAPLVLSMLLLLAQVALDVAEPLPLKIVIDNVLRHRPLGGRLQSLLGWLGTGSSLGVLALACAALLALAGGSALLEYVWSARIAGIGQSLAFDLRGALFRHVQRLSISFHASRSSGETVHRLTSDIASVQEMLVSLLSVFCVNILMLCGVSYVLLRLDPLLGAATLAICGPLFFLTRSHGRRIKAASRRARAQEGEVAALVQETIGQVRITKAFAREGHQAACFDSRNRQSLAAATAQVQIQSRLKPLVDALTAVGVCVVVYVGVRRGLSGQLSVGGLVVFLTYQKSLYGPIRQLSKLAGVLAKGSVGLERIAQLLAETPEVEEAARGIRPRLRGAVQFERVSFSYQARRGTVIDRSVVLSDVSFSVPAGSTVAIVGSTGAGKSTLASLIPRFYDPTSGLIRIDGHDVRELALDHLRQQIALVLQEAVLFHTTIWENIAYGLPEAPAGFGPGWLASLTEQQRARFFERIAQAAAQANALEFIERLPQGFATVLGERGADLSGGQRQRIAIARAMIRDAPILILDEPTTGLDAQSEALVLQALERLMAGRTSFVIAHRLATVRRADLILVVEGGRIVELGSHTELYGRGGRYRELAELQLVDVVAHRPPGPPFTPRVRGRVMR